MTMSTVTYELSCGHEIERSTPPPKLVRCNSCVKGNDGYPKRKLVGPVAGLRRHETTIDVVLPEHKRPNVDGLASLMPKIAKRRNAEQQAIDEGAASADGHEPNDDDERPFDEPPAPGVIVDDETNDDEISAADLLDGERTAAMIMERYRLAKIEHVALKAWDGEGEQPETPNLDALKADQLAGIRPEDKLVRTSSTSKPKRERKPAPVLAAGELQYSRNGNPLRGKHNRFSSLAGYCKIPVADLVSMLEAAGVTAPKTSPFEFTLPSGVKIAAVISQESEVSA